MISNGFHFCDHCGSHLPDVDLEIEELEKRRAKSLTIVEELYLLTPSKSRMQWDRLDALRDLLSPRKATDDRNP